MPNPLLTLGSFSFDGLESPDRITISCKQRLVVHRMASGSSITDSLGNESEVISFQGIFSGRGAIERVRSIENLKSHANSVALVWQAKTVFVVIQDLALNYLSNHWIPKNSKYIYQAEGNVLSPP